MTLSYYIAGDEPVVGLLRRKASAAGFDVVEEVRDADVALTYCLALSALEDRYFDDEGLIKNAAEGTVLVDLSPATPSLAREISAIAQVSDLRFVEAPLAVRRPELACALSDAGNLVIFAAGEDDDVESVEGLLRCFCSDVVRAGRAGSAQIAKARHTIRLAALTVGEIEADALLRQAQASAGVSGGFHDVVENDAAVSLAQALGNSLIESEYTVAMLLADVAAAMTTADDVELILPQLESALHLLELIAVIGGVDKGVCALSLVYRDERDSAEAGLDWSRAEGLFSAHASDERGWTSEPDLPSGFGGYSSN